MAPLASLFALAALSAPLASAGVIKPKPKPAPTGLKGLNALAASHGRYFGTAIGSVPPENTDTKYVALSGNWKEFGMVTHENALKWEVTEPQRNKFDFSLGDEILNWAHKNHQAIRAHNLVWHSQLPSWLTSGTWDKPTLISIMKNHIKGEAGHYRGKVYCWDVVNEPFNDDGTWRSDLWYDIIGGPEFIAIALQTAQEVDPFSKKYINDYNVEGVNAKSDAHYALAKTLLKQKVPLHGFGLQGHLVLGTLPTDIATNVARFAKLGLEWAFTELDIRMDLPDNAANKTQQAKDYAYVTQVCVDSPACVGITVWETSDDYSWIPGVFPTQGDALLFDADKNPKPAYYAVADVLAKPKTIGHFFQFWL